MFLFALLGLYSFGPCAQAGTVVLPGIGGGYRVDVSSFEERRFAGVAKQEHDFSCGSAALATLLRYHYGRTVSEKMIFEAMFAGGQQEKIRKSGFSLLDMKRYLRKNGFRADGFRLSVDRLKGLAIPAITLINTGGYMHFVVIKGVDEERVLVGDPAVGIRSVSRTDFEGMWNGIAFLIRNRADLGRSRFNAPSDWTQVAEAPMNEGVERTSRSSQFLSLPLPVNF